MRRSARYIVSHAAAILSVPDGLSTLLSGTACTEATAAIPGSLPEVAGRLPCRHLGLLMLQTEFHFTVSVSD